MTSLVVDNRSTGITDREEQPQLDNDTSNADNIGDCNINDADNEGEIEEEGISPLIENDDSGTSFDIDAATTPSRDTARVSCTGVNFWWIAGMALALEALTCFFRFGLHLQSTRDTAGMARYTFGLRIHHGYMGALLVLLATTTTRTTTTTTSSMGWCACPRLPFALRLWCFRVGWSLILSDVMHHFLVLWPITGSPQFDIFYPTNEDDPGL